jgi:FdhD protein
MRSDAGAMPVRWVELREGQDHWKTVDSEVIEEALVSIFVNGQELASILCTPRDQDVLALGLLWNEGIISSLKEVEHVDLGRDGCCVDIWLTHGFNRPERRILTSGCGSGITFDDPSLGIQPLRFDTHIEPEALFPLFTRLNAPDSLYARARGVHTAALSDGKELLVVAEDIGRHNTLDRLLGLALIGGVDTAGLILLATGRLSSEMLRKGARMGCPIIASRNSPTSMSVALAQAWNITLIGYVRQHTMRVYAHPHRLTPGGVAALSRPAGAAARGRRHLAHE